MIAIVEHLLMTFPLCATTGFIRTSLGLINGI